MKIRVKEENLIKKRIISGYTQRDLATKVGISNVYLSQIERGDRNPGPRVAKQIADALTVDHGELFFLDNNNGDNEGPPPKGKGQGRVNPGKAPR